MFERLSACARRVVVVAQDEALVRAHHCITPDHILKAIFEQSDELYRLLKDCRLLTAVNISLPYGELYHTGSRNVLLPFTPESRRALEDATKLTDGQVTEMHLLKAIVNGGYGEALYLHFVDVESLQSLVATV